MTLLPQLERELLSAHERRRTRRPGRSWFLGARMGAVVPAAAVLVALAVVAVVAGLGGRRSAAPEAHPVPSVVFTASSATSGLPVGEAVARSLPILRRRLSALYPHAHVRSSGATVTVSGVPAAARATVIALAAIGQLRFYDWEADVLTPNGQTAASGLPAGGAAAVAISQGAGTAGAGAESLSRNAAARLAARTGHGATVVEALPAGPLDLVRPSPATRFYVLRDQVALTGADILLPAASTAASGGPDLEFDLTGQGAAAFHRLTAQIARRGAAVSRVGDTLEQHFAIALDSRLIAVPSIDFRQYPDGITDPGEPIEVDGWLTPRAARVAAILLRYGPLDVALAAR